MKAMRRTGALFLAVGYGLAFVVVCLAACFMPAMADHACCASGGDGIRAGQHDCCSVMPGVEYSSPAVAVLSPTVATSRVVTTVRHPAPPASTALVAASPPLVLRV